VCVAGVARTALLTSGWYLSASLRYAALSVLPAPTDGGVASERCGGGDVVEHPTHRGHVWLEWERRGRVRVGSMWKAHVCVPSAVVSTPSTAYRSSALLPFVPLVAAGLVGGGRPRSAPLPCHCPPPPPRP
jgi:hypothetical protein